jgi:hypothetical protein
MSIPLKNVSKFHCLSQPDYAASKVTNFLSLMENRISIFDIRQKMLYSIILV